MALKFTDKLKNLDLSKAGQVVSNTKSSITSIFEKKSAEKSDEPGEDLADESVELTVEETKKFEKLATTSEELRERVTQYIAENGDKIQKWYSDSKMNEKLEKVGKKIGATLLYPVLLLYNLFRAPSTTVGEKMAIIAPLAYFIMPIDMIPDGLAVFAGAGYVDDGAAVMACVKALSSSITLDIQNQAKAQCKEIVGEVDETVLKTVSTTLNDNQEAIVNSVTKVINESGEKENKKSKK
jgi:uncharacterized membrane protein YkvA (DUF1232 family)